MPQEITDWSELLGSRPDPVDREVLAAAVGGRTVLVTGAGGSIGSALALRLAALGVRRLLLLDAAEHGLFELGLELNHQAFVTPHELIVGDVSDSAGMSHLFASYAPEIVFHAAACKHVALMEANPFAAARTNILGTACVLKAAAKADQVILVSTDKAVDPIGIMGATKRVAELLVLASSGLVRTKVVRLPNVLGSSGSVGPTFLRQIARGRPLTVTEADSTRYFLTVDHVVSLLIGSLAVDGPRVLLIPDPGPPMRILDLARALIRRSSTDIDITMTAPRPGDKLHEAMHRVAETPISTKVPALRQIVQEAVSASPLEAMVVNIEAAIEARDLSRLLALITDIVPEYRP